MDGVEVEVEGYHWIVIAYKKMSKSLCMVCTDHMFVSGSFYFLVEALVPYSSANKYFILL